MATRRSSDTHPAKAANPELDDSGIALDNANEESPKQESNHGRKHTSSKFTKEQELNADDSGTPAPPKDPLIRLRVGSKVYFAHQSVLMNGESNFFIDHLLPAGDNDKLNKRDGEFSRYVEQQEITPPVSAVDGACEAFSNLLYYLHVGEWQPTASVADTALVYVVAHDTGTERLQILAAEDFGRKMKKIRGNWGYHGEVSAAAERFFGAYCDCSVDIYGEILSVLDARGWLGPVLQVRRVREVMAEHPGLCMLVIDYLVDQRDDEEAGR